MPLSAGTKLGTYEVVSAIGAGGMGEVYQAHDTKLRRDVAIKVLPEAFAHDPEKLSRFQREAKLLASLNHPNIATIHGLEDTNGTSYLVMELVPGDTLQQRVKRDGPIPVEEALTIAKQIAEALEAAHEKSIIHRDLKPANVKLTPEGKVKVLDFGLAKAFAGDGANDDPSNSPTLSAAATMQGTILGTAAYMSPEQARGKACDKRKWQISTEGGTEPMWNPNGRELFYRSGDKMMAVDIATQTGFAAGKARMLFEGQYVPTLATLPNYDVSLDGQRFLMLKPSEQAQAARTQINVVLNWFEELKRRVPAGRK